MFLCSQESVTGGRVARGSREGNEAREIKRGANSCIALQALVRTLLFTLDRIGTTGFDSSLEKMESHWKILNRRMI